VKSLEPTFGGVNLEDIKAPECFYIEEELRKRMDIPVMHDDQHGTAIITSAALTSALEIAHKKIEDIKVVVSGAGAAALACVKLYLALGLRKENLVMYDKDGIIRKDRPNLHPSHEPIATDQNIHSLAEALVGADVFLGLSVGGIVTPEMVQSMAPNPIVFALANPNPEIDYETAMACRPDIIMATGRSDHPNQVNNVLGFPYIFRGALDVRATEINEEMKLAAVKAISHLAKEPVPEIVNKAYGDDKIVFGRDYLIPKPLDPRLITEVSSAVAKAAMESGVAKIKITDWEEYKNQLLQRVGVDQKLMTRLMNKARQNPKRIVFAEGDKFKVLKAAQIIEDEGLGIPILLGNRKKIDSIVKEYKLELSKSIVIDHHEEKEKLAAFANILYQKRKRKGITLDDAQRLMQERNYFGTMLLETGEADAFISGSTKDYSKAILPALHVIGVAKGVNKVAGLYIINSKKGPFFFADATVNIDPTVDELVEIVGLAADFVQSVDVEPRIALLSYSNFGSSKGKIPEKAMLAAQKANEEYPHLMIDGDIQADMALKPQLMKEVFPFSMLAEEGANTLIFPDLASGNIAYKLLQEIGGCEAIGPVLLGMAKPVHILQLGSSVREIVNMATIALVEAGSAD
jgi:malate dehydrogenase (oxaloacetate-decarboxylating)(NADP+)